MNVAALVISLPRLGRREGLYQSPSLASFKQAEDGLGVGQRAGFPH